MAITARSLAQVKNLGLALVAGADAADREIDWAHAIELADPTPYLAGGELVMTTGINIGTDDAAQLDYVARLVSADAAALAVDTGTTFSDVPAGVLAAGDALGLPVLEVPPSTPFIAIARVVVDALKADELRSVQRVVDEQEVLTRATLRDGIPGVVSALADCLSGAVMVADTDGTILAAGGGQERLTAALAEAVRTATSNRQAGYVTADGDAFVTVQKLRAAQPVRGHLAVRTTQPMSNADRLLVSHAVSLISIALEKPARVVDAEQRLRRAVTHQMVCGTGVVDSGMLRYFGFDPRDEVVVVVLTGAGPTLAAEQILDRLLATAGSYLMTPVGDEMVIVIPAAGSRGRLPDVLAGLAKESGQALRGGASEPVRIAEIDKGVEQARIAALADQGREFTEFGQLDVYGVLLGGRGDAELRVLAGPLDPLVEQGDELVGTLAAFLTHNGQMEAAATDLGIHRHTMRNRMQRISELLADDVQSADTRTQLWLAIRARELLAIRRRAGADRSDR
jgi:PucR family transcriptional regulator, purine catabolism regulatory protein